MNGSVRLYVDGWYSDQGDAEQVAAFVSKLDGVLELLIVEGADGFAIVYTSTITHFANHRRPRGFVSWVRQLD
jgi:hypothetical protein